MVTVPGGRLFPQSLHELPFPFEFMLVSLLEFLPSRGIMAKPFSQLVAWGRVFDPLIDDYLFFLQSPGPQPVDEDPLSIAPSGCQ